MSTAEKGSWKFYTICEPKAGKQYVQVRDSHDSQQWAAVVGHIAETLYLAAQCITVVQDNLSAHRKAALYEVFAPERARSILRRLRFVHTPKHGSWLNIAEIELSVLSRVALKKEWKANMLCKTNQRLLERRKQSSYPNQLAVHHKRRKNQTQKSLPETLTLIKH